MHVTIPDVCVNFAYSHIDIVPYHRIFVSHFEYSQEYLFLYFAYYFAYISSKEGMWKLHIAILTYCHTVILYCMFFWIFCISNHTFWILFWIFCISMICMFCIFFCQLLLASSSINQIMIILQGSTGSMAASGILPSCPWHKRVYTLALQCI